MPDGQPPGPPGEEPERPASWPTEPFGEGSRPTEPFGAQDPRQPYGPPPGQYGYGYQPAPQTDSAATAALVIAIVGFFVCPPVGGVVALIMALSSERRIRESGGRLTGLDQARIAKVIAIIELALVALGVIVVLLIVIFALSSDTPAQASAAAMVPAMRSLARTARTR
jgi:hypothetical protein